MSAACHAQFKDLAATFNKTLAKLSGKVQWVQSFIAADRTFCIYFAKSEASVSLPAGWAPNNEGHRSAHHHRIDDCI
jgi:uncharacterized protein DUF4242